MLITVWSYIILQTCMQFFCSNLSDTGGDSTSFVSSAVYKDIMVSLT